MREELRTGDRVRLNPNIRDFRFLQGPIGFDEIGNITDIYDNELYVHFPSMWGWHGEIGEVLHANEENAPKMCKHCGKEEDLIYLDEFSCYVCSNCLNEKYEECHDCGKMTLKDNMYYIDSLGYSVCNSCRFDNYFMCEDCNGVYSDDYRHDIRDCCYCDDCYEEHEDFIYDYHEFNDWQLFKGRNEEKAPYYIGKEIELEPCCYDNESGVLKAIKNINAVGMHDSSLDCGGVEVVTHPESWEYLKEHKEDYVRFFDDIENIDYGNNGNCGLHFHVSRPSDEVVSRLIVLLESFKEEIKNLSRRSEGQLDEWAKFLTDTTCSDREKIKYTSKKYLKDNYLKSSHGRYYALNLCNSRTIEFRFFNGVNNFEEFWGALQFIHNIMDVAMDEKRELNTIKWKDLLEGKELQKQAEKYGVLNVDKTAKDTTEVMERYEEIVEKYKKEIKRIVGNLVKYVNKEMSELNLKKIKTNKIDDVLSTSNDFIKDFQYRMQYLDKIVNLYNYLNGGSVSIENVKDYWENTKHSYPVNTQRYKRYDNQMKRAFKALEEEVK